MTKAYTTAAFIFRRDLRLQDNTGLGKAFELADRVLPRFIFDPRQQCPANEYFSAHSFQCLVESLEDLARRLSDAGGKLYRFKALAHEVISSLIEEHAVEAVFVNRDHTLLSRARDNEIQVACVRRCAFF
jgi:deoxyribodipyrimidine photo-lyase